MSVSKPRVKHIGKLALKNAFWFVFNLASIIAFQIAFGSQNILPGIAIVVGLTMFPVGYIGIKPLPMAGIIIGLYTGGMIVGQTALISPWLALPINFLFTLVIMLLTCEPNMYKPAISFLLCFVFAQSTPVSAAVLPSRVLGGIIGGVLVAVVTVYMWKKNGQGADGRSLKEQIQLCAVPKGYILRMAIGISLAMFIGTMLGLKKPLWISIVVMSLTQLHLHESLERIRHRLFGNVVGIIIFLVVFRMLIPEKYAFALVLFLGYINFFMSEYKYKQIVNAVSAVNASLVLLDTSTAVENRLLCLAGGAVIVLVLYEVQKWGKKLIAYVKTKWFKEYEAEVM